MNKASKQFDSMIESEITNTDSGYELLEKHQKSKKEILESSLITFEEGKELLARLKEISFYGDSFGKHATTSACYSIEHLLELLNDRRRNLEELWKKRKLKLEQCIQICYLRDEIKRVCVYFYNLFAKLKS